MPPAYSGVIPDFELETSSTNITMNPLTWIKAHPFKAVLFTCLFTLVASLLGAGNASWPVFLAIYLPVVAVWFIVWCRDSRVLGVALLAGLFLTPPSKPKAQAGIVPVVVGVTVVVVGGWVIYKVVNFCQRHFSPQPDPSTNAPGEFAFDGPVSCGATLSFSAVGSCYVPPATLAMTADAFSDAPEVPFRLELIVSSDGKPSIAAFQVENGSEQVDWDQFQSELAAWGLNLSPYGGWADSYSVNGLACGPADCPISFDSDGTVTVNLGGELHTVLVERSHDLSVWETVLRTVVPANQPLMLTDMCSDGMTIYRVSAQ